MKSSRRGTWPNACFRVSAAALLVQGSWASVARRSLELDLAASDSLLWRERAAHRQRFLFAQAASEGGRRDLSSPALERAHAASETTMTSSSELDLDGEKVPSARTFCAEDKVMPQLFLLGAQKCATTSLALDLMQAGVATYNVSTNGDKEAHFFDKWPKQAVTDMSLAKQREVWMSNMPACPAAGANSPILADFTPSNLRSVPLPAGTRPTGSHWGLWFLHHSEQEMSAADGREMDLPRTLRHFYGVGAKRLAFVVMLREPLSRMQSAWYHAAQPYSHWRQCRDCKGETFANSLNATLLRSLAPTPVYDDWLWTSMYGRHLEHWLYHFSPNQFYVMPYRQYTHGNKSMICRDIAGRLSPGVKCEEIDTKEAAMSNTHDHPALIDDCPNEIRKLFHKRMKPEKQLLLQVLAQAHQDGAGLANYFGPTGNLNNIHTWLKHWW